LYTKCGFTLHKPLYFIEGQPLKNDNNRSARLVVDDNDISLYNNLCKSAHGFSRDMELHQAVDQGVVFMIEHDGAVTGYAVAKSHEDLKTLIGNASTIFGLCFFVPGRNHQVIRLTS
jgi:hypothetical protein